MDPLDFEDFKSVLYKDGPEKVMSRLQLLVSPCIRSPVGKKRNLIREVEKHLVKIIEDEGHEGSGFISKEL